jgi:hypothetical protein
MLTTYYTTVKHHLSSPRCFHTLYLPIVLPHLFFKYTLQFTIVLYHSTWFGVLIVDKPFLELNILIDI